MTTALALGVVGAVVGYFFGVPGIGFAVGYALGGYIDPTKVYGPKLTDLKLQGSQYGAFEPIPFGKVRLAGNVIWQTDLKSHEQSSGKGGGTKTVSTTYSASFDIEFCRVQGMQLAQLFADGRLIYDAATGLGEDLPIRWYDGADDQVPDPTEQAVIEVDPVNAGLTPAYRGRGRMVATDMDLSPFFNRIPMFEAVISGGVPPGDKIRLVKQNNAVDYGQHRSISAWTTDLGDATPLTEPSAVGGAGAVIYLESTSLNAKYRQLNDFIYDAIDPDTGASVETTVHLWAYPGASVQSTLGRNVAVSKIKPLLADDHTFIVGSNFAFPAGVDTGEFVQAACVTPNGRTLFLFTNNVGESPPWVTKWWKIRGAAGAPKVIAHGTCGFELDSKFMGYGNFVDGPIVPPESPIAAPQAGAMMAEQNGRYFWSYYGISEPGPYPPGSCIRLWKIDDSNKFDLVDYIGGGTGDVSSVPHGTVFPSVFSMAEGYAGTIGNHLGPPDGDSPPTFSQTALWTRLLPGEDGSTTVGETVAAISEFDGMSALQYDVSELPDTLRGFILSSLMPGRSAIETLMPVFFFDATEEDGKLVYVKRGSRAPVVIPDDNLDMHDDGQGVGTLLSFQRKQDVDLPARVTFQYFNVGADYQIGSQPAERIGATSDLVVTINVAVVLSDSEAKQRAEAWIQSTWVERTAYTFVTGRKYTQYGPCDVLKPQGIAIRVTKKTISGELIKWEGVENFAPVIDQVGVGGASIGSPPATPVPPQDTDLMLLDIPFIADPANQQVYYAAMAGHDRRSWAGAVLQKSVDGTTFATLLSDPGPGDTFGQCTTILGDFTDGNVFDEVNSLTVLLTPGSGSLQSVTRAALLADASVNLCVVGDAADVQELLQFRDALLIAPRTYVLSGLLHGRFGTEWAIGSHGPFERFILLSTVTPGIAALATEYGALRYYRAITGGSSTGGPTTPPPPGTPGPGLPPPPGTIVFPFSFTRPMDVRLYTGSVVDTSIIACSFTTDSSDTASGNLPRISTGEWIDSPRTVSAVLSTNPGSFQPIIDPTTGVAFPLASSSGTSATIPFVVGAVADNFGLYPRLAHNTTYWFNFNVYGATGATMSKFIELVVPT